jgi:hypothetical protein
LATLVDEKSVFSFIEAPLYMMNYLFLVALRFFVFVGVIMVCLGVTLFDLILLSLLSCLDV